MNGKFERTNPFVFVADEIPWAIPTAIAFAAPFFNQRKIIVSISLLLVIASLFFRYYMKKTKEQSNKKTKLLANVFGILSGALVLLLCLLIFHKQSDGLEGKGETPPSKEIHIAEEISEELIYDWEKIVNAKPGETVLFGKYRLFSNTESKDRIAWLVLAREDDKLLLLSEKCLDCKQYNESDEPCTWKTSSLRAWLNQYFLYEAFTSAEQEKIVSSSVPADLNPDYNSVYSGELTTDQLFLLSIQELERYLPSSDKRQAVPTQYALSEGAGFDHEIAGGPCWWWLRTPGENNSCAADVRSGGAINYEGYKVTSKNFSVRPALWINIAN